MVIMNKKGFEPSLEVIVFILIAGAMFIGMFYLLPLFYTPAEAIDLDEDSMDEITDSLNDLSDELGEQFDFSPIMGILFVFAVVFVGVVLFNKIT